MNTTITAGLEPLEKPKQKLTAISVGGGFMGGDVRKPIVTQGLLPTQTGFTLAYSVPRGRKRFYLMPMLEQGVILLKGHDESVPIFESHVPMRGEGHGYTTMMITGKGGRFVDMAEDGGKTLIKYLKDNLLLHTLTPAHNIVLLEAYGTGGSDGKTRQEVNPNFKQELFEALGDPVELEKSKPTPPKRRRLLTDRMIAKLQAHDGDENAAPQYKVFTPEGAATWLLCSLEGDDTLWAVCDLGMGCVEYGTVSLRELESIRGPLLKLPVEIDIHWSPPKMTMSELLSLDTLQKAK